MAPNDYPNGRPVSCAARRRILFMAGLTAILASVVSGPLLWDSFQSGVLHHERFVDRLKATLTLVTLFVSVEALVFFAMIVIGPAMLSRESDGVTRLIATLFFCLGTLVWLVGALLLLFPLRLHGP